MESPPRNLTFSSHHQHHSVNVTHRCPGRTHCTNSNCLHRPTLHPVIGIPLSICTAGLSCAVLGIYRGYTTRKARIQNQNQNQLHAAQLDEAERIAREYQAMPRGESAEGCSSFEVEKRKRSLEEEGVVVRDFNAVDGDDGDDEKGEARLPSYAEVEECGDVKV